MGRAIQQDFEYRTEHLLFTAPIPKSTTSEADSSAP